MHMTFRDREDRHVEVRCVRVSKIQEKTVKTHEPLSQDGVRFHGIHSVTRCRNRSAIDFESSREDVVESSFARAG
jgi:hypothetical protein